MTLGGAFPPELVGPDSGWNSPSIREAEIPGAGGIATARALATIWSATIVETDGTRLLTDETIAAATIPQSQGPPIFDVPGPWPRLEHWLSTRQRAATVRHVQRLRT